MKNTHSIVAALLLFLTVFVTGCATNRQYRTEQIQPCRLAKSDNQCATSSIQRYTDPDNPDTRYTLGFVEFDDQGQLHDRAQLRFLLDTLNADAAQHNLLMVVFVHGWKHNAAPGDGNIASFRKSLENLSELESIASQHEKRQKREVVGIFLGWRGLSLKVFGINNLTFWERKNTAHIVGQGAVAEVLARLEEIRNVKTVIDETSPPSQTRLVIIGHSFGGAVVYSALSQILMERFVQTKGPVGQTSDARGFGDLVVLINPAFEALRFMNLSDMANERGHYFPNQLPVMAVLTSEADWATKYAFWGGRLFSTLFQNDRDVTRINQASREQQEIDQSTATRTAIGHYAPIQTHYLQFADTKPQSNALKSYKTVQEGWDSDEPGGEIRFPGSVLKHLDHSVARNPYLLIKVDKHIIPNHSDIFDERVSAFLKHLILISTQDTSAEDRMEARKK